MIPPLQQHNIGGNKLRMFLTSFKESQIWKDALYPFLWMMNADYSHTLHYTNSSYKYSFSLLSYFFCCEQKTQYCYKDQYQIVHIINLNEIMILLSVFGCAPFETTSLHVMSTELLRTSIAGALSTSSGSHFQCLTTHSVNKYFPDVPKHPKLPLKYLEIVSLHPRTCYLRIETHTLLGAISFQIVA